MAVRELTDPELIGAARKGDADAYGELYRRHSPAALAAARALTRSRSDADDVASEAFARVLRALQSGGGPDVSFRPYLVTAVRNVFYDRVRRNREEPSADMSDEVNVALLDASNSQEDGAFAAAAFATLPERWQLVLWHTEVEGRSVSEVAPLLGLAPNAVAALAYRAREGLRQAYLQAHLRDQQAAECRECANNLGAYVRDGLSARDRRRVDAHLNGCASCTALVAELADTNNTLRAALIPALIGVSSAAYLGGLGGGSGALAWFTRLPKRQQAAAGGGAAAGVVALALLVSSLGGGSPSAAPSPSTTAAPAPAPVTSEVPPPTVPPATPAPTPPTVPPATTVPPPSTAPRTPVTPTTAVPRTTVPVTTLPPAPPSIAASAVQRTVALANGQVRIEVAVTNTGVGPANGVRIDVPAPAGATFAFAEHFRLPAVTFVSALAPGWSCTGNVSCTVPTLAAGATTVALLTFDISPAAPANLTLTPEVVEPVGALVTITPVTLTVNAIDGLLAAETARGTVRAIGNSVTTCDDMSPDCVDARNGSGPALDHNAHVMQYVNTAGGSFNSSSAQLSLSGTVARAFLVWGGDVQQGGSAPAPGSRNTVVFSTPGGRTTVVADTVRDNPGDTYFAVAEVTSLVSGSGTYAVADVQTALGTASFGGWSLVLIEHDPTMPERLLLVAAPLAVVSNATPLAFDLELLMPYKNGGATVVGVCFEGDRSLTGDTLALSGQSLANLGRGAAPAPRDPAFDNLFGTDVFSHRFGGLTGDQLVLQVSTTDDRVMVGAVALAIDL